MHSAQMEAYERALGIYEEVRFSWFLVRPYMYLSKSFSLRFSNSSRFFFPFLNYLENHMSSVKIDFLKFFNLRILSCHHRITVGGS